MSTQAPATSNRPPIYSVGYEHETPDTIHALLDDFGATLVDVRGSLFRCKSGFGPRQLEARFGDRYVWKGPVLGNRGENIVKPEGIDYLVSIDRPVILMCKEANPAECHRHFQIAIRLLKHRIDVRHIFEDILVLASELQRSLDQQDECECTELEAYKATLLDLPVTQYDLEHATKTGELTKPSNLATRS